MKQAFTRLSPKRSAFHFTGIRVSKCCYLIILFVLCLQNLQAQNYIQVPATGGITSPTYPTINFSYGPFSGMNVRSAMLYTASELSSISTPVSVTSLGFKLANSANGSAQGYFKIYIIPTTDNNYSLSSNWSSIEQHPDIIEVYNSVFLSFSPITGYINFNLTTPFTLLPGQGFYLVTDWESGIQTIMNARFDCNTSLTNSYHLGFYTDPLDHQSPPPTTLPHSSNYRHVLRLGYAGGPTGISENSSNNLISVYPNPVQEVLQIDLGKFGESKVQATLRDLSGKTIQIETLTSKHNKINLNGIATGIYSLQLNNATETVVKRIVIE